MPLPVPNLDDRRFDDLVAEARARLASHLPELTDISPGDPLHSLVDLFAWLTETILYRANLIPERQRRVFLNLLQVPLRPARAARGVVCVDASPTSVQLAPLLKDGAQLQAGKISLTTMGELQPTCLALQLVVKQKTSAEALADLGLTLQDLAEQFGLRANELPTPFQPHTLQPGQEILRPGDLDQAFYLACLAPRQLESRLALLRQHHAGIFLNLALAPADQLPADTEDDAVNELHPRPLMWELAIRDEQGNPVYLPLEVVADSSAGARRCGVVRLRLPANPALFHSFAAADPMFGGVGDQPPELADPADAGRVAFWLRLRCPDQPDLALSYLGLNGVEVVAQGYRQDMLVGMGTGLPDQVIQLPDASIEAASLQLDVEDSNQWVRWQAVDFLAGQPADAPVFALDAHSGRVQFGDGISGRRPPQGARIRALAYRYGGGSNSNLAADTIKEIANGAQRHKLRHEWPLSGGVDAETITQAEQRIPQFLTHRNRAVTPDDFIRIALDNPVVPVGRAEVRPGFLPGARIEAARNDVPGVVSLFVLPPGSPALGHTPKPDKGLLKDVFTYLLNRVLIGTELYVLSPQFIPLAVSVRVQVQDRETEQQTLQAVRDALVAYLWPLAPGGSRGEGWPLGGAVRASELITQVARVSGILAVNTLALFVRNAKGWRALKDNEALTLEHYQLPELLAVRVETGSGSAALPAGLDGTQDKPGGQRAVPVPVIPDLC